MRKILFLILVGILAFSLESCSSSSSSDKSSDKKSVQTVVVQGKKDTKQEQKKPKSENKALSAAEKAEEPPTEEVFTGLIPSTKPEIRVRGSIRGRQDPFAVVTIQPQIEIIEDEEIKELEVTPPSIETPEDLGTVPTIEESPAIELAENVVINGLIEFGDRIKLIVQAPEEAATRYVEIGQYLSNGQVLVKRIEPGFPAPKVILEQNGVEVLKVVGQADAKTTEEARIFDPLAQESTASVLPWLSN